MERKLINKQVTEQCNVCSNANTQSSVERQKKKVVTLSKGNEKFEVGWFFQNDICRVTEE